MANDFDLGLARDFGTALLLGALIGAEREQNNIRQGFGIAGLRSFVLLSLVGAIAGFLSVEWRTPLILPIIVVAVAGAIVAGYVAGTKKRPESVGITTELASITACLLGALVTSGYRGLGVGVGVVVAALLAYKQPLHRAVDRIDRDDVLIGMRFLLATFIVLPLLPDRTVDPWHVLNPYKLWLLVLLISGLSLVGYIASRWLGERRGLVLTAITGGLVSSTAVTLALAKLSNDDAAPRRQLAGGVLLSWAIMSLRVLATVAILQVVLLRWLWLPCVVMALLAGISAFLYLRAEPVASPGEALPEVPLKNPFSLLSASKFALLFAAVQLLLALAQAYLPRSGTYTIAVLAGTTDVDAITLSMAERVRELPSIVSSAAIAIMLASFSNTVGKAVMAITLGRGMTRYLLPIAATMVVGGAVALWLA